MNITDLSKQAVRATLARVGLSIRRIAHEERLYVLAGHDPAVALPPGAEGVLRYDNPRLLELERRYQAVNSPVCQHTQWRAELRPQAMDLRYFRGDNAYMWQYRRTRDFTRLRYYLYARYIRELDQRQLLGRALTEDGQFGCFTFRFDEMPTISRDLLDSINELYFLDRHWNLFSRRGARVLDIGAGYGRLAHRMLTATDYIERYWCIDAIPRSTFLCEYYLGYRGCLAGTDGRAVVIPLDEMETTLQPGGADLAVNIHSFSEMSHAAVEGWVRWLEQLKVPHLMVVPNEPDMLSKEADGTRRSYLPVIERAGYRLVAQEPTIRDSDVRKLFGVADFMFLFAREAGPA